MVKQGNARNWIARLLIVAFLCGLALLPQIVQAVDAATGTVTVGGTVFNVAVSPDSKYAYATNLKQISVIDTASNKVIDTINIGGCDDIAIAPDGKYAYVLTTANDGKTGNIASVAVIDTASKEVTTTINLDGAVNDLAISPDGKYVYITEQDIVDNKSAGVVTVIDTVTNTVTKKVPIEGSPEGIAITPSSKYAYVTSSGSIAGFGSSQPNGTVSVIDTAASTVIATVTVGVAPPNVAISPDGEYAYVTNSGSNSISVIDTATNTVATTITGLLHPFDVALTPNGEYTYVTEADLENDAGRASVISTATDTVTATVTLVGFPYAAAITPDGAYVYIANGVNGTVSVIDTATNTALPATSVSAEFSAQWLGVAVLTGVITVLLVVIIVKKRHRKTNSAGAKSMQALTSGKASADIRLANLRNCLRLFFVF